MIGISQKHPVFKAARWYHLIGDPTPLLGKRGWHQNNISAAQGGLTCQFRKFRIIANQGSDAQTAIVKDINMAADGKIIRFKSRRQNQFPVPRQSHAVRAKYLRGVIQIVAITFGKSIMNGKIETTRQSRYLFGDRAICRFCQQLYIIANIIAAGKQLGQNQQIKTSLSVAV